MSLIISHPSQIKTLNPNLPKMVDCIILSYSKTRQIKQMTQAAIYSLHASSPDVKFNVYVIETEKGRVIYDKAKVIQPQRAFNYNAFINIGLAQCASNYIVMANNDLIFHKGWFEAIAITNADSASPYTDGYKPHQGLKGKIIDGHRVGNEVCGWCIVVKKSVLDTIGKFDEQFDFWYQDNDYAMQLVNHGFNHKLVGTSHVDHLYSKSHALLSEDDLKLKTTGAADKFYAKYRKTICLTMIVKDEATIIEAMLNQVYKYIDTWSIVDTGSTDGTQQKIKEFFAAKNIPGELHERPWREFGPSRTESMQLADGKADYMWVMDADDGIDGEMPFKTSCLYKDSYAMRIGKEFSHWRQQLFKSGLDWEYKGVRHEYAYSAKAKSIGRLEGKYSILARCAGTRSKDPQKYQNDAKILEAELIKEPNNSRYWFYLGQSYFDYGDWANSKRCYEKRVSMGGWQEEMFYAQWRVGLCAIKLNESDEQIILHMTKAYEIRPVRAEALCTLAEYLRNKKRFHLAYMFARMAASLPLPETESLFIMRDVYTFKSLDELAVNAYHTGRVKEAYDIFKHLIDSKKCPLEQYKRTAANLETAERVLKGQL